MKYLIELGNKKQEETKSRGGGGEGNENRIVRDWRVLNATRKQNQSAKGDKLEMTEDHSLVEAK